MRRAILRKRLDISISSLFLGFSMLFAVVNLLDGVSLRGISGLLFTAVWSVNLLNAIRYDPYPPRALLDALEKNPL